MIDAARAVVDEYTGNVQVDRQVDAETGHSRWGSGENTIDRVELLNAFGQAVSRVRSGDGVTIRIHYAMGEPIERPVFGLAIHTLDGTHVTGPNTRDANCVPDQLSGNGHVDLAFDRLLLLPGTYDLSCSLYDYHCLHPYDYRHKLLRFDVERGPIHEQYGLVSLGGTWKVGDEVSQ
jgi:hypothetical protein